METEKVMMPETESKNTECHCDDLFLQKCDEIYQEWRNTAERVKKDLDACGGKPYIRETTIHKVEIFKSPSDTIPIDTFETKKTQGFSLCTLLMAGGMALILSCCAPKKFKLWK